MRVVESPGDLLFQDEFDDPVLDATRWFPFYLPHWSSSRSPAHYRIEDSTLRLSVGKDQSPWCPEFDPGVRVSNLQTGHWSGPLGSSAGQHRFAPDLVVREEVAALRLFLPLYCRLDMRARVRLNPWNLAALWLIGFEDEPGRSGEITVFEAFGHALSDATARIGMGIKQINDPHLVTEFDAPTLEIDARDWHVYTMDWRPEGIDFLVDGMLVKTTRQSPAYPMQIMLNLYDLPTDDVRTHAVEATFDVDYIRAWKTSD
jgi:hypothetical protein